MGKVIIKFFQIMFKNSNDLIEKIMILYHQPEKRKEMGENGYNRVIKDYNWNKIANDYIDVFKNLVKSQ